MFKKWEQLQSASASSQPKQIRDWRNKKQKLLNAASTVSTLEEKIIEWIEELCEKQMAVSRMIVIRKAKTLAHIEYLPRYQ